MKSIEFERVSVAQVRKELDESRKKVGGKRAGQRTLQTSTVISDAASRWLAELPADVRPMECARRFPRIVNGIADLWRRVAQCEEYLDSLVVDLRGDRTGFPQAVAKELQTLRGYYADLHPQRGSAWDFVEGND
jgi:hypothetical protein